MSDGSETTQPGPKPTGMPPVFLLGGFLIAATAGSAIFVGPVEPPASIPSPTVSNPADAASGSQTSDPGTPVESTIPTQLTIEPVESSDPESAKFSQLIVGEWRQDYYGTRTLSVKADGTATMTIVPSPVFAIGFGPKIDLTMFWSVKDGHLDYGVSGGTPTDKVKLAAKTWGDHWVEKIIELNETKLDLLSVDGSSHSIWERVSGRESSTTESQSP